MIGVIPDANVIVSANLKPKGFEAYVVSLALNGRIRQYISPEIFEEYNAVLRRPQFPFVPAEIERFLARVQKGSNIVRPTTRVAVCTDEADNRFLECAEARR